jgi:hypothetical protein
MSYKEKQKQIKSRLEAQKEYILTTTKLRKKDTRQHYASSFKQLKNNNK